MRRYGAEKLIFFRKKKKRIKLPDLVRQVKKAIERDNARPSRLIVYPYWVVDVYEPERKLQYPHLVVLTDISPARVRLLKIELCDYAASHERLIRKMMSLTGQGIILCPKGTKIEHLIDLYNRLSSEESIVTDGIVFGRIDEFLNHGIMGTTFVSLDAGKMQFLPETAHKSDESSENGSKSV